MAGLYIHIPFCKQACYYCDFHFSTSTRYRSQMIDAITREVELQKAYLNHEILDTIYFGGGTPSILASTEIEKLINSIHQSFRIKTHPEITLEANPDDLSIGKLKELKSLGINRLSIGIQSFNAKTLKFLNRAHDSVEAIKCIENARLAGFENISIDLIFSIPGQTINELNEDIDQTLALDPEHISVYSLTIEEKTVFGNWNRKGKFIQVTDEDSALQFDLIISKLDKNRYEQYEISNFCRDGNYAKHNTSYWKNINYLGLGPGAHSYNGSNRQFNMSNNHKYMKSIEEGIVPAETEFLTKKDLANEYLLTTLRTKWGCDLQKLKNLYSYDLTHSLDSRLSELIRDDLIIKRNDYIFLSRKGKFLADSIIAELFWI